LFSCGFLHGVRVSEGRRGVKGFACGSSYATAGHHCTCEITLKNNIY
jgi:hypothetical protein